MGGSSPSGPRCLAPQAEDLAICRGIRRFAGSHSRAYVPGEPYPALGSVIQTLGRRVPSTRRGEVSGACATRQPGPSSQLLGPLQTQSRPPARPLLVAPYLPDSFHSPPKGPVATVPQAASLPPSAPGRSPPCPYWASRCLLPGMPRPRSERQSLEAELAELLGHIAGYGRDLAATPAEDKTRWEGLERH